MKLKILSMGLRSGESLFGGVLACVIPEKLPATIRQRQDGSTEHRTTKLCGQSWRWCKNGQGGGRVWTSCILVGSSSRLFLVYCWLFDLTLCKTSNHGKDLTPVFPWCCLIFALFFYQWLMGWTLSCWRVNSQTTIGIRACSSQANILPLQESPNARICAGRWQIHSGNLT